MDFTIEYRAEDGQWTLEYNRVLSEITITFRPHDRAYGPGERTYTIPTMREMRAYDEYVVFTTRDTDLEYQFKFEQDAAFIGDIFDQRGEHIESIACHSFWDDE
jgi:hypothetical protein